MDGQFPLDIIEQCSPISYYYYNNSKVLSPLITITSLLTRIFQVLIEHLST